MASIDPEEYFDFQATRPQVQLADGHTRRIVWPANEAYAASTPGGDVVLLLGVEPQLRWRTFTHQIAAIAEETEADLVVTLGALLADVVHRRPVSLIGTATDQALIDRFDLQRSRYEGPTGIVGVLHDTCQRPRRGVAVAVGRGARVRIAGAVAQGRAGPRRGGVRGGRPPCPGQGWPPRSPSTRPDRRVPGGGRRPGGLRRAGWRLMGDEATTTTRDDGDAGIGGAASTRGRRRADGRGHRALPARPGRAA